MSTVFDPAALVCAWEAHDRWCLSLTPPEGSRKRSYLPTNGGVEVTEQLRSEQKRAAGALGVDVDTFVLSVLAERRADPGPDVAGAIERVLAAGFDLTVETCKDCGRDVPAYEIYQQFHKEHCPEVGPQRRPVEDVELPDVL